MEGTGFPQQDCFPCRQPVRNPLLFFFISTFFFSFFPIFSPCRWPWPGLRCHLVSRPGEEAGKRGRGWEKKGFSSVSWGDNTLKKPANQNPTPPKKYTPPPPNQNSSRMTLVASPREPDLPHLEEVLIRCYYVFFTLLLDSSVGI